jgi:D-glycero-D-manno-heptose 1,7-bisphosphate phosphatase
MMASQPAVFLDRDGVINQEHEYVHRIDDFHFIDGIFDACRKMSKAGFSLIVITNQAGIARGYYTEDDFHQLTVWMLNEFRRHGVEIDDVYYCPHHPLHGVGSYRRMCDCRKPGPEMILRAAREHSLDLSQSILVGDKVSDIEAGRAAGLGCCVLVLSGHALDRKDLNQVDIVFEDLPAVANAVVKNQLCVDETNKKIS